MTTTQNYSIGVVTYHARFEDYFKPLVRKLAKVFPDKEIICVLNGHPDQTLQMLYLREAVHFLSTIPKVRYITHIDNQSLSKCWNELILLASFDNVLILNDDTQVSDLFRSELEPYIGKQYLLNINRSWSHFLIRKETVRRIGWFEERLPGVGFEDSDYAYRLAMAGIPIDNLSADGIRNYAAKNERPGWENTSPTIIKKYTGANREFFDRKWRTKENSPTLDYFSHISDFGGGETPFTPIAGMETPLFYDLDLLESTHSFLPLKTTQLPMINIILARLYFKTARKALRLWRRFRAIIGK